MSRLRFQGRLSAALQVIFPVPRRLGLRKGSGVETGGSAWRSYSSTLNGKLCERAAASAGAAADWAVLHKLDRPAIFSFTCRVEHLYQGVVELGEREVYNPPPLPSLLLGSFPDAPFALL